MTPSEIRVYQATVYFPKWFTDNPNFKFEENLGSVNRDTLTFTVGDLEVHAQLPILDLLGPLSEDETMRDVINEKVIKPAKDVVAADLSSATRQIMKLRLLVNSGMHPDMFSYKRSMANYLYPGYSGFMSLPRDPPSSDPSGRNPFAVLWDLKEKLKDRESFLRPSYQGLMRMARCVNRDGMSDFYVGGKSLAGAMKVALTIYKASGRIYDADMLLREVR
jgi:hypothetical protein